MDGTCHMVTVKMIEIQDTFQMILIILGLAKQPEVITFHDKANCVVFSHSPAGCVLVASSKIVLYKLATIRSL
jgi:hypothetical protein